MDTSTIDTKIKTVPAKVGTVITEKEYDTLVKMLSSTDEGDHRMAQAILNQCNVKESIYWIWRLAKHYSRRMVYLRTKASRNFRAECDLFSIAYKHSTGFARFLIRKDWMTTEIFQRLKEDIVEYIRDNNYEENFYEVHIIIKESFRKFDPDSQLTKLKSKEGL
jgi:hypothetical protein